MLSKPECQATVCDLIRNRLNIFAGIRFVRAASLLGVYLGPEAGALRCLSDASQMLLSAPLF